MKHTRVLYWLIQLHNEVEFSHLHPVNSLSHYWLEEILQRQRISRKIRIHENSKGDIRPKLTLNIV
jgi:hypothetical protein